MQLQGKRILLCCAGAALVAGSCELQAATITFVAPFAVPNETFITPNSVDVFGDGGYWTSSASHPIDSGAGPSQFHSDWGTYIQTRLHAEGSSNIQWNASNGEDWDVLNTTVQAILSTGGPISL